MHSVLSEDNNNNIKIGVGSLLASRSNLSIFFYICI